MTWEEEVLPPGLEPPVDEGALRSLDGSIPSKFLHSLHLHCSEHMTPAWKHSQYFLRHPLFLQWQPRMCLARGDAVSAAASLLRFVILGRKARGLRSRVDSMAAWEGGGRERG